MSACTHHKELERVHPTCCEGTHGLQSYCTPKVLALSHLPQFPTHYTFVPSPAYLVPLSSLFYGHHSMVFMHLGTITHQADGEAVQQAEELEGLLVFGAQRLLFPHLACLPLTELLGHLHNAPEVPVGYQVLTGKDLPALGAGHTGTGGGCLPTTLGNTAVAEAMPTINDHHGGLEVIQANTAGGFIL